MQNDFTTEDQKAAHSFFKAIAANLNLYKNIKHNKTVQQLQAIINQRPITRGSFEQATKLYHLLEPNKQSTKTG
jgi:hypothetical protein